MSRLDWKRLDWRRRALLLLTAILMLCAAANPTLASVLPVIDALGLDVLFYLFAAQMGVVFGRLVLPLARARCEARVRSAVACASCALRFFIGGYLRELAWNARHTGAAGYLGGLRRFAGR